MNVAVRYGDLAQTNADTIVVNLFENDRLRGSAAALDEQLGGMLANLLGDGGATGKAGEVRVVYPANGQPARRVVLIGLGARDKFNLLAARNAAAHAIRAANAHGARHVATAIHGDGVGGLALSEAAQATAEGSLLALHSYRPKQQPAVEQLTIVAGSADYLDTVEAGVNAGAAISEGVRLARDLAFAPPNIATPQHLAEIAEQFAAQFGLEVTIGDRDWMRRHEMGALLAVAQGAGYEPRFIVLEHKPNTDKPIVLAGKGITFDTGGINLKRSDQIGTMKGDMAGAAAVLGTMRAVAEMQLPVHVVGLCACTENMPDAGAYRPSDVITASNGKTIEIISTDAEGRLALADALVYAARYQPEAVIDLATLTGTAVAAMGKGVAAAMFSNDEQLQQQLMKAATKTHERLWPFPLYDDYRKTIESPVADLKNSGGRTGGLGTSAVFLEAFTSYPWAHLDIAGFSEREASRAQAYEQHEATGFGVRLLVELLRRYYS